MSALGPLTESTSTNSMRAQSNTDGNIQIYYTQLFALNMVPSLPIATSKLGGVLQPCGVHGPHVVLRQSLDLAKQLS